MCTKDQDRELFFCVPREGKKFARFDFEPFIIAREISVALALIDPLNGGAI